MKLRELIKDKTYFINKNKLFLFSNLVFVLYLVFHLFEITYFEGVVVGFMSLILPGLGWALLLQSRIKDTIAQLIISVFITTIFFIIGLLCIKLIGHVVSRRIFVLYLFVITNIGYIALRKDTYLSLSKYHMFIFIIIVPILAVNAMTMEIIWDADAPLTVTAYGLIHKLIPYSDLWLQKYEFQHPPWAHFISSCSIFLMGHIDDVKVHYRRAKMLYNVEFPDPYEDTHFKLENNRKLLFSSRISHCILAGLLLLILFEIVKRETQSSYHGLFSVFIFLNPEIIVRFSHTFYITPSFFILLSMCYSYLYLSHHNVTLFLFGFWSAWINQKNVIVPLAVLCADFFRLKGKVSLNTFQLLIGFTLGYLSFCYYGACIHWEKFYHAFLIRHGIVWLFMKSDLIGFMTSWTRAILFFNPLIFILGIITIIYMTKKSVKTRLFVIPCWFYIGFLIFVFCVYPHIKNCSYVYLPLIISLTYFISRQKRILKHVLLWGIILLHCLNLFFLSDTIRRPNAYYVINDEKSIPKQAFIDYFDALKRVFD